MGHRAPIALWRHPMHDYYPLIARAVSRLEGNNTPKARQAVFERVRIILLDQLRIRQPPASDAEIVRERAALEEAIRKVEADSARAALPQTGSAHAAPARRSTVEVESATAAVPKAGSTHAAPARRSTVEVESATAAVPQAGSTHSSSVGETPENLDKSAAANGTAMTPATRSDDQEPADEAIERANGSAFGSLRGIHWLDQLMLDAAQPRAPDSLREDARTVLKWLGIENAEAIQTEHYDQFSRAFQRYISEWRTPSSQRAPAMARSPRALNDDIRSVFSRLLEREQAARILDQSLLWFANVWIRLIVVLNIVAIIGLVVTAPTLWVGLTWVAETYFNAWNWVAQVVALSPSLVAIAWLYRRTNHPWSVALSQRPNPHLIFDEAKRLIRNPANLVKIMAREANAPMRSHSARVNVRHGAMPAPGDRPSRLSPRGAASDGTARSTPPAFSTRGRNAPRFQ
jgi:hypothetical protein